MPSFFLLTFTTKAQLEFQFVKRLKYVSVDRFLLDVTALGGIGCVPAVAACFEFERQIID